MEELVYRTEEGIIQQVWRGVAFAEHICSGGERHHRLLTSWRFNFTATCKRFRKFSETPQALASWSFNFAATCKRFRKLSDTPQG
jgi:hypothetical protein